MEAPRSSGALINTYRRARVFWRQILSEEPIVPVRTRADLEFHGNEYCGWPVPVGRLSRDSVVVDVGLGEDISFSTSLMSRYGCRVHGFDPTPRSIEFVERTAPPGFVLHPVGVASARGSATFYLPNDSRNVSGSVVQGSHLGDRAIAVDLVSLGDVFEIIEQPRVDLLKIDIEGAEYGLIESEDFDLYSKRIGILCIEFHHRWSNYGPKATLNAVNRLAACGFSCAWRSATSNEEFLFVRTGR